MAWETMTSFPKGGSVISSVVLVHGTRSSARTWTEHARSLRAAGHHVTAIDLPGHGARFAERFTFDAALAAIDDAVAAAPTPPLLVGQSLGGYTSLAYAARHGDRLAGVVLTSCSTEIAGKPLDLYRAATMRLASWFRPHGTWHVVGDMLTALSGYRVLADLRTLDLPVWLVNGRFDPLRLDERRVLAAVPSARLHVVRGAGHDVHSHAPDAFTTIVLAATAELDARAGLAA